MCEDIIFENIRNEISNHFDFNDVQKNGFSIEEIYDNIFELTHKELYHTITLNINNGEFIIGHYKYIPGVRYRLDGTGEPDEYEPVDDFSCFDENIIIETFLKLENNRMQQEELFAKYEQEEFDAINS